MNTNYIFNISRSLTILLVLLISLPLASAQQKPNALVPIMNLLILEKTDKLRLELNFDMPTERQDGTPLTLEEIGHYSVRYKLTSTADYAITTINPMAGTQTYRLTIRGQPGRYEFSIATIDSYGISSGYSSPVFADFN